MECEDETGLLTGTDASLADSIQENIGKRMKNECGPKKSRKKYGGLKPVTIDLSKAKTGHEVLKMAVGDLGWKEYSLCTRKERHCDFYWNTLNFEESLEYASSGKVNKFPGMPELLCKINLFRALDQMKMIFPDEYSFHPRTWMLPAEYHEFCSDVKEMQEKKPKRKPTFIVKPDSGSQGEGIYLLQDPRSYINPSNKSHVVQEYLSDVLLINEFKFDLRVYCVLQSIDPLMISVCKEGLGRFSTVPYERPTSKNMCESFMHLTNYSLNKRSETYVRSDNADDGSKRTLTSVFRDMSKKGYNVEYIWNDIEKIICKTVIAILPELKVLHNRALPHGKPGPSCFQILGFDILIMKNLEPVLLEVNSAPSLNITQEIEKMPGVPEYSVCQVDEEIKRPLVRDTLRLLAPKNKFTRTWRKRIQSTEDMLIDKTSEDLHIEDREFHKDEACSGQEEQSLCDNGTEQECEMGAVKEEYVEVSSPACNDTYMEEYEETQSCLDAIYPELYGYDYDSLRILERLTAIFLKFNGIKAVKTIGATGFRNFARKCGLIDESFTSASVDIFFIDYNRKWDHLNPDRVSGLCFRGFVDGCFEIARKKFSSPDPYEMLNTFLSYCENNASMK